MTQLSLPARQRRASPPPMRWLQAARSRLLPAPLPSRPGFWRSLGPAMAFGLANFAAHCLTAYKPDGLDAKSVGTALAFGIVSFSLTMCLLEAIDNDIEELGIVDPSAVMKIMMLYVFGLCAIVLAAHAEVVSRDKAMKLFAVPSSLGLFFAIVFQAWIERTLLEVFRRAEHRYPEQYARKEKAASTLRMAVLLSLALAAVKLAAKLYEAEEWVMPLVLADLLIVAYVVCNSGSHARAAPAGNPFETYLDREGA